MIALERAKLTGAFGGDSGFADAEGPSAHPATLVNVTYFRPSIRVRHTGSIDNAR